MDLRGEELKSRIAQRRKELEARLEKFKADSLGSTADHRDRLSAKLAELDSAVKDGWKNLSDVTIKRLNDWLKND